MHRDDQPRRPPPRLIPSNSKSRASPVISEPVCETPYFCLTQLIIIMYRTGTLVSMLQIRIRICFLDWKKDCWYFIFFTIFWIFGVRDFLRNRKFCSRFLQILRTFLPLFFFTVLPGFVCELFYFCVCWFYIGLWFSVPVKFYFRFLTFFQSINLEI